MNVFEYQAIVDTFYKDFSHPVLILGANEEILYKNQAAVKEFKLSEGPGEIPKQLQTLHTCLNKASDTDNGYIGTCEFTVNDIKRQYQCIITSTMPVASFHRFFLCILVGIPNGIEKDALLPTSIPPTQEVQQMESEPDQQWRHSIEAAHAGAWHLNLKNMKLRWSRRMLTLHGTTTYPHDYNTSMTLVNESDRERLLNETRKAISDHSMLDTEYSVVLPDGSIRWIEAKGRVLYDTDGKPTHIEGIAFDITPKKQIEEEIAKTREFSKKALDSLDGIFYIISSEGKFLAWNQSFEKVSGYSPEEIREMHPTAFFRDDDVKRIEERIAKVFTTGAAIAEADFYSKDGTHRHYYFTGKLVEYEGNPCLIGMGVDISDRKLLESQLLHAQKMEGIGRLAGGIAHDFNNLLSVILGYTELLENETRSNPLVLDGVRKIQSTASRAVTLTNQLLTLARKQPSKPIVVEINRLINGMIDLLTPLVGSNIKIHTVIHPHKLYVMADPVQLEQVLVNLIVNAKDAMNSKKDGVIEIKTTKYRSPKEVGIGIGNEFEPNRDYLLISVIDNGTGMDAEVLAQVYDPFFTTKETGKGTGLGLSICYGIVRQHDGHISISSKPGEGTEVDIYLPLVDEPVEVESELKKTTNETERYTILVAEDEPMLRELTVHTLNNAGYHILEAEDGAQAMEIASEYTAPIHILVSDLMMPRKGGRELAYQLLQIRPEIKVLFVSGYAEMLYEQTGIPEFPYKLLHKPYSGSALKEQINRLLSNSEKDAR